jgi:hypothetical protein
MEAILNSDKDLFIKFRDSRLTYDQLRARTAERKCNIVYRCLDDLKQKGDLDPKYYEDIEAFIPYFNMLYGANGTYKDVLRPLEPYEASKKCLKSIKYNPLKADD